MTYQEFNKRVFEFYAIRASSSFCNLSIDTKEIESIIPIRDLAGFNHLQESWEGLIDPEEGIPQYFGLIAIQCYAASLMHKDDKNDADAYQIRLQELLDLPDSNTLQQLFRGSDTNNPIQEQIWFDAKAFLQRVQHLSLELPEKTRYAYRFVRYPISQALLNTEDLKHFTTFFAQEFRVKEEIPFPYFKKRLESSLYNIRMSKRAAELLGDPQKKEKCIRQVFDFYNGWHGDLYLKVIESRTHANREQQSQIKNKISLLLQFEWGKPKFFQYDIDHSNNFQEINPKEIFQLDDFVYPHSGLIFFNPMEYYPDEYESSRFLYLNTTCYILVNKKARPFEDRHLEQHCIERIALDEQKILYKCQLSSTDKTSILGKFFQAKNPVRLVGGIKVTRRKEYLRGYGPSIHCAARHLVLQGNGRCEYHPQTAATGLYKVRVDNFKDVEFIIVDNHPANGMATSKNKGWNLIKYTFSSDYQLEGCLLKDGSLPTADEIRVWINTNLKKRQPSKYEGNNILLKAITKSTI